MARKMTFDEKKELLKKIAQLGADAQKLLDMTKGCKYASLCRNWQIPEQLVKAFDTPEDINRDAANLILGHGVPLALAICEERADAMLRSFRRRKI